LQKAKRDKGYSALEKSNRRKEGDTEKKVFNQKNSRTYQSVARVNKKKKFKVKRTALTTQHIIKLQKKGKSAVLRMRRTRSASEGDRRREGRRALRASWLQ